MQSDVIAGSNLRPQTVVYAVAKGLINVFCIYAFITNLHAFFEVCERRKQVGVGF